MIILRAIGCTNVQGFYLGRPKPARDIPFADDAALGEEMT
jgi:EAL domain-containing protein (putative c-di-GMP-specific phosphodiesterase class I)